MNQQMDSIKKTDLSFAKKMIHFLNVKTGTILLTAVSMSIGFALKDFIQSFVSNILQPSVIFFINTSYINKIFNFSNMVSRENNELKIIQFISSAFTLFFIVIAVYLVYNAANVVV